MSTDSPQPPTPQTPQHQPEQQAKIEYDRLIAYFDKLLKVTGALLGLVITAAGFFLWKNTADVQTQANASIKATQDRATQAISDIGNTAQATAKSEAQKAIADAFEKQNVQRMIDTRVNSEVESAIQKNLARRIESFQSEITELSKATSLINMAEIQSGTPESGDSLHQLIELQYTASPKTRELVKANLSRFAKEIEKRNPRPNPNRPTRPRDLMGRITHYPNAEYSDDLWIDFRKMQELTGWNVQVFDTHAAINWCEQHKPKCDE